MYENNPPEKLENKVDLQRKSKRRATLDKASSIKYVTKKRHFSDQPTYNRNKLSQNILTFHSTPILYVTRKHKKIQ